MILYVNALGMRSGKLQQCSYVKKVKAQELFPATAIQTTTAAGMAAVIELWTRGLLSPASCARRKSRSTASRRRDGEGPCTPNVILQAKHAMLVTRLHRRRPLRALHDHPAVSSFLHYRA